MGEAMQFSMLNRLSLAARFTLVVLMAIGLMGGGTLYAFIEFRGAMIDMKLAEVSNLTSAVARIADQRKAGSGSAPETLPAAMKVLSGDLKGDLFVLSAVDGAPVSGLGGTLSVADRAAVVAMLRRGEHGGTLARDGGWVPGLADRVVAARAAADWIVGATQPVAAVDQTMISTIVMITVICVPLMIGFIFIAWQLGAGIARPVAALVTVVKSVAAGNRALDVPGQGRGDEIGTIARSLEALRASLLEADELKRLEGQHTAERQARAARMEAAISDFRRQVNAIMATVTKTSVDMTDVAGKLAGVADATRSFAERVETSAAQDAEDVQAVAVATAGLSESVHEVGAEIARSVMLTSTGAEQGREVRSGVETLDATAQKIGEIVDLIRAIAAQTNLLALNATIEAARAGDAGRGFAIVAQEVKALAVETSKATEEIAQSVGAIQSATQDVVGKIGRVTHSLDDIAQASAVISGAVTQQREATAQISERATSVARGSEALAGNIAEVSAAARATADVVVDVRHVSGVISDAAAQLEAEIAAFLRAVAA